MILLLLVAGGAGAESGSVSGSLVPAPRHAVVWLEGAPAGSWSAPREPLSVSQRGARFEPDFVIITVGQTIAMPNDDRIIHNVFSASPAKKFDLGHYPQGDTRSVRFDKPGVIDLFCNIHDNMHATVVVAPSSFWALVGADGKFHIAGVPAGNYKAVAFSPEAGMQTQTVRVGADPIQLRFDGLRP
jgi:plastocyanin